MIEHRRRESLESHHLVERYWDFSWGLVALFVARTGTWATDRVNGARDTTWCGVQLVEPRESGIRIVRFILGPLRIDVARYQESAGRL